MNKFEKWLEQCPVEYDEIHETSDKDIYWHAMKGEEKNE